MELYEGEGLMNLSVNRALGSRKGGKGNGTLNMTLGISEIAMKWLGGAW